MQSSSPLCPSLKQHISWQWVVLESITGYWRTIHHSPGPLDKPNHKLSFNKTTDGYKPRGSKECWPQGRKLPTIKQSLYHLSYSYMDKVDRYLAADGMGISGSCMVWDCVLELRASHLRRNIGGLQLRSGNNSNISLTWKFEQSMAGIRVITKFHSSPLVCLYCTVRVPTSVNTGAYIPLSLHPRCRLCTMLPQQQCVYKTVGRSFHVCCHWSFWRHIMHEQLDLLTHIDSPPSRVLPIGVLSVRLSLQQNLTRMRQRMRQHIY